MKVIKIVGVVDGRHSEEEGNYIASFDATSSELVVVPSADEALHFESFGDAIKFWQTPSTTDPVRTDGKPNRPLTVYNVEVADYTPKEVTT